MSILIKNGRVITADADREADVLIEGETIAKVADVIDPASLSGTMWMHDALRKGA